VAGPALDKASDQALLVVDFYLDQMSIALPVISDEP
jgi:hypothetical protein